jgi:hypothetical protein
MELPIESILSVIDKFSMLGLFSRGLGKHLLDDYRLT